MRRVIQGPRALWLTALLALTLLTPAGVMADVPLRINYQGRLADGGGNPVTGSRWIDFSLFDAASGGNLLWNEQQTVEVADGVFNVELGANTPLQAGVFASPAVYLEISIHIQDQQWETLDPRRKFNSAAFAIRAGDADTVGGSSLADLGTSYIDAAGDTMSGDFSVNANLSVNHASTGETDFVASFQSSGGDDAKAIEGIASTSVDEATGLSLDVDAYNSTAQGATMDVDGYSHTIGLSATVSSTAGSAYGAYVGATAEAFSTFPVYGVHSSAAHNGTSGDSFGFFTDITGSDAGDVNGVYSRAVKSSSDTDGTAYGGYFIGESSRAWNSSSPSTSYGVYAVADSFRGSAVYGEASNTGAGDCYGGYFIAKGESGRGLLVHSAQHVGASVSSAADGIVIAAGTDTSHSYTSGDTNGIEISRSDATGIFIGKTGKHGVHVVDPDDDGILVSQSGVPGGQAYSDAKNGFEVAGAEGNGLFVGHADADGVVVKTAGSPTYDFFSSDKNGFEVAGAQGSGLSVGFADLYGVFINRAEMDGVHVNSAGGHGLYVSSATGDGIHVTTANDSRAGYFGGDVVVRGTLQVEGADGWNEADDEAALVLGNNPGHFFVKSVFGYGLKLGVYGVTDAFNIEETSGQVGIGVADPTYRLHVNGTVAGTSWTNLSSRDYKTDIERVDPASKSMMLVRVMDMDLSTYKYKEAHGGDGTTKLGFIAEEMPEEVLSPDGKGVDLYELLTYTIGAMQASREQDGRRIKDLEAQNRALKALVCQDHPEAEICARQ